MITVGFLWHSFYSGNLGVSALSDANMSIVTDIVKQKDSSKSIKYILFGPKGDDGFKIPDSFANLEYVEVSSVKNWKRIRNKLLECDLVLDIGSGDSFSDIYGFKRFLKILGLKFLVPKMRKKLIISPQTLGPYKSWWSKAGALLGFKNVKQIFTRDNMSLERVKGMLPKSVFDKIKLTTDVAFSLEVLDEWPEEFPTIDTTKKKIGINVSGLLYGGGYTGRNQFGLSLDYARLIHRIIENFSLDKNIKIWLIPHVYQINRPSLESDLDISKKITEKYPNVSLSPLFYHAREAKTFISKMDLVLAARMHACIAAVSSGTACIPMSYSVKFEGLFSTIEYPYTLDLKTLTEDDALDNIVANLSKQNDLEFAAECSADIAKNKLQVYKDYITECI